MKLDQNTVCDSSSKLKFFFPFYKSSQTRRNTHKSIKENSFQCRIFTNDFEATLSETSKTELLLESTRPIYGSNMGIKRKVYFSVSLRLLVMLVKGCLWCLWIYTFLSSCYATLLIMSILSTGLFINISHHAIIRRKHKSIVIIIIT